MASRVVSTTDYWAGRSLERIAQGQGNVEDLWVLRSLERIAPAPGNADDLLVLRRMLDTTSTARPARPNPWAAMLPATETRRQKLARYEAMQGNRLANKAQFQHDVVLSHGARSAIEWEIQDAYRAFHFERLETGGYLFGLYRPRLSRSYFCHATGPGPDSLHGPGSMQLARAEVIEAELPDLLSHLKYGGMWHIHPSGPLTPSTADRNAWAALMEQQGWSRHVALIVGRGSEGYGWTYPEYTAWVTRADYDKKTGKRIGTVCEPARVEFNVL